MWYMYRNKTKSGACNIVTFVTFVTFVTLMGEVVAKRWGSRRATDADVAAGVVL